MARGKSSMPRRRPVDLTGSLTPAEKEALVVLTTNIIDKMERQISSLFDSPTSTPRLGSVDAHIDDSEWSHISNAVMKNHSAVQSNQRVRTGTLSSVASSCSKAHRLLVQEEAEAMTPQLAELKKEALNFFGKWQTAVTLRVSDMEINEVVAPSPVPVPARRGRARGERGGAPARGRGGSVRGVEACQASAPPAPPRPASLGPSRAPPVSQVDPAFHPRYHPIATALWLTALDRRRLMLHLMLLLLLSLEEYTSYTRALLLMVTSSLHLPYRAFQEEEVRIARAFSAAILALPPPAPEEEPKHATEGKGDGKSETVTCDGKQERPGTPKPAEPKAGRKRGGPATQDVAATVNLLVGPLIAAGIGSVPGGGQLYLGKPTVVNLLGPVLESPASIGGFFGVFGAIGPNGPRPMSRSMEQFARDVQDFALLPLGKAETTEYRDPGALAPHDRRMRFVLGVGGWTSPDEDAAEADTSLGPWNCFGRQAEAYAVRWDLAARDNLGNALETAAQSKAWEAAKKDIASHSSELEQSVSSYTSYFSFQTQDSGSGRSSGSEVAEPLNSSYPSSYKSDDSVAPRVFSPPPRPKVELPPSDLNTCRFFNQQLFLQQSVARQPATALLMYCAVLGTLMECHWPLSLLKISKIIDNPWHIAMVRAEKTGFALAEAIIRRIQGNRPVSLVGYSLGARAIYTCLMILAERRLLNLIDSVVMIGAPAPSESRVWLTLKSVVSGRLINVYSETDYLLAFLYRTSNVQFGLAGVQAVYAEGIENHNVGDLSTIGGHLRYRHMVGTVLRDIGWEDLDKGQVERGAEALGVFDRKFEPKRPVPTTTAKTMTARMTTARTTMAKTTTAKTAMARTTMAKTTTTTVAATPMQAMTAPGTTCAEIVQKKRRKRGRRGQGKSIIQN